MIPKTLKLFGFLIVWLWAYLMKIIQQTHRVHTKIELVHFYFQKVSNLEYNKHTEKESNLKINYLKRSSYW
jgi:hypothetical protein